MSKVKKAILLAAEAHAGDKWGEYPYMAHLALAADNARQMSSDVDVECAAWLHDILEDHPEYAERVEEEFPELVKSLQLDCRDRKVSYNDYISRIIASGDKIAIVVKLADMQSNLFNNPKESLRKRYESQIDRLELAFKELEI